jgi:MtN3 and saliva related transmembrane protein
MDMIDTLGMMAGIISSIALLPQAMKVKRTQSTSAISASMYMLYCLGLVLWGVYAWMIRSLPLLITEIISGIMAGYILFMKFKDKKSG